MRLLRNALLSASRFRVRRVSAGVVVLLASALAIAAGTIGWINAAHFRTLNSEEVKLAAKEWGLPETCICVHAEQHQDRDGSDWYEFQTEPAAIPSVIESIKHSAAGTSAQMQPLVVGAAVARFPMGGDPAPSWWLAAGLTNPDLVSFGATRWFVLSRDAGTIYVYHFCT